MRPGPSCMMGTALRITATPAARTRRFSEPVVVLWVVMLGLLSWHLGRRAECCAVELCCASLPACSYMCTSHRNTGCCGLR